eukprot:GHVN01064271.1.p1 GENE.GHVN01064271.1~~GHVN01064271.1.p1  ORF type:complete len:127 (-),score=3.37 GHVN01064271.1:433-813(-)
MGYIRGRWDSSISLSWLLPTTSSTIEVWTTGGVPSILPVLLPRYFFLLESTGFSQCINEPTHNYGRVLDLLFANSPLPITTSVIPTPFSDHASTSCALHTHLPDQHHLSGPNMRRCDFTRAGRSNG